MLAKINRGVPQYVSRPSGFYSNHIRLNKARGSTTTIKSPIRGVIVPVITPFRGGSVDLVSFAGQILHLVGKRIRGFVAGGTTGEGHVLNLSEKMRLIDTVVKIKNSVAHKNLEIIAGTGTYDLQEAIEVCRYAKRMGCVAVLALPPKTSNQKKIEKFYRELSKACDIPIIAYNIPSLTGIHIKPKTLAKLIGTSNVIGLKDSSADAALLPQWKKHAPNALLIVGCDRFIHLGVTQCGAVATIPSTANVFPREVLRAFSRASKSHGARAQAQLDRRIAWLESTGNMRGSLKAVARHQLHTIRTETIRDGKPLTATQRRAFFASCKWA